MMIKYVRKPGTRDCLTRYSTQILQRPLTVLTWTEHPVCFKSVPHSTWSAVLEVKLQLWAKQKQLEDQLSYLRKRKLTMCEINHLTSD